MREQFSKKFCKFYIYTNYKKTKRTVTSFCLCITDLVENDIVFG